MWCEALGPQVALEGQGIEKLCIQKGSGVAYKHRCTIYLVVYPLALILVFGSARELFFQLGLYLSVYIAIIAPDLHR